ncbi:cellulase family glycosylhydrolase [Reichenbachiella agarivorans]|uniref:mannan endo-1,4-beta-mannosidase n=1 Tax=Reichenbachiella agarivorans TaxID=2979464 RepID=A0ABY6CQK9_9BACT|nr:cellulase family glycosylhydrolase [Reichenbachiella agarivorans]UXP32099.1 cellulase family glycosylhydrolase [Reichenbachiella agarivorans]
MNNSQKLSILYVTVSFMVILLLLFYGTSQFITFFKTGAERRDMLLLDSYHINDFYQPQINWINLGQNEGRVFEPAVQIKMGKDYIASYFYQFQAFEKGEVQGLHDYFTEQFRAKFLPLIHQFREDKKTLLATTITHEVDLKFYSEDGTIATLEDRVVSFHKIKELDLPEVSFYDTSQYEVMLLLEDNHWRIRHKVSRPLLAQNSKDPKHIPRTSVSGQQLWVDDSIFHIRGLNYYPQQYPWQEMWLNYDSIDFDSDFALIKDLGFNTLRIFIPFGEFNDPSAHQLHMDHLQNLMDKIHDHELKAIVTLFDFFLGYDVVDWTLSDRHAEQIVTLLKDHPALLAWDLKNEPDLDFDSKEEQVVLDWLFFINRRIKSYDPHALTTIGWSQPEHASHLANELDFISFHYYRDPTSFAGEVEALQQHLDVKKPLFLGETGMHSFSAFWYPWSNSQEDQATYYADILLATEKLDLHWAMWTMYDFVSVPANVAGRWPWQKSPQKAYGFIDTDGNNKKIYNLIQNHLNKTK